MSTSSALQNSMALLNEIKGQLNQSKTIQKSRQSSRGNLHVVQNQESPQIVTRDQGRTSTNTSNFNLQNYETKNSQLNLAEMKPPLKKSFVQQESPQTGIQQKMAVVGAAKRIPYTAQQNFSNPEQDYLLNKENETPNQDQSQITTLRSLEMAQEIRNNIKIEISNFSRECDQVQEKIKTLLLQISQEDDAQEDEFDQNYGLSNDTGRPKLTENYDENSEGSDQDQNHRKPKKVSEKDSALQKSIKKFDQKYEDIMKSLKSNRSNALSGSAEKQKYEYESGSSNKKQFQPPSRVQNLRTKQTDNSKSKKHVRITDDSYDIDDFDN